MDLHFVVFLVIHTFVDARDSYRNIQYRSFTDETHCSQLNNIHLATKKDNGVFLWQGGSTECEFLIAPPDSSGSLCISIPIIAFTEGTEIKITHAGSNGSHTIYFVDRNVKPFTSCLIIESGFLFLKLSTKEKTDPSQLKLYVKISVISMEDNVIVHDNNGFQVTKTDVSIASCLNIASASTKRNIAVRIENKICINYECEDCSEEEFIALVTNRGKTAPLDSSNQEESSSSELDVNEIIGIAGGALSTLIIPVVLVCMRLRMKKEGVNIEDLGGEEEEDDE